ncbi:MAG: hypothetical protein R6U96_18945 [Promethearchaeia archaeon]
MISLANEDNFDSLPEILNGILEVQSKGYELDEEQLRKLDPLLKLYDETIQDLTLEIQINNLKGSLNKVKEKTEIMVSNYEIIEPPVRDKIISFLINHFYEYYNREKALIRKLISFLDDQIWTIRIRIIEFLNDIFSVRPNFIKMFDKELEILYNEKDIDVIREGLDLLLRVFLKTYNPEDLSKLINSINEREWVAQEKILMLISKLCIERPELLEESVIKNLINLLDHTDYLVSETVKNTMEEIMEHYPNIFDDIFFSVIQEDSIDNMESLEQLLRSSIIENGYSRFKEIFEIISFRFWSLRHTLVNLIRKLTSFNKKMTSSFFSQIIPEVLKEGELYQKFTKVLKQIQNLDLYIACYQTLNNVSLIENPEIEARRKELLTILKENMPELKFLEVKKWLQIELKEGPVSIHQVCEKFQLDKSRVISLVNKFQKYDDFETSITNGYIMQKANEEEKEEDLLFLKQWKVHRNPEISENEIKLFIQVKNISGKKISNFDIDIDYPENILTLHHQDPSSIRSILENDQNIIMTYIFRNEGRPKMKNSHIDKIKFTFSYLKDETSLQIEKELDLLLL